MQLEQERLRERNAVDAKWHGPPISWTLLRLHQFYRLWCYAYCRETEHHVVTDALRNHCANTPDAQCPRVIGELEDSLRGRGAVRRLAATCPPCPFFYNERVILGVDMELATPIGAGIIDRLQCANEVLGIVDSIPRGICREVRDLLDGEPR